MEIEDKVEAGVQPEIEQLSCLELQSSDEASQMPRSQSTSNFENIEDLLDDFLGLNGSSYSNLDSFL